MRGRQFIIKPFLVLLFCFCFFSSCAHKAEQDHLLIAAASSLETVLATEVIPAFEARYPHIRVDASYAASGHLRHQIEAGLAADVFLSADEAQVAALDGTGTVVAQTSLLKNELVLIVPAHGQSPVSSLDSLALANILAIGDPASVPAGRYAKTALTQLGLWEELQGQLSLATDVSGVLHWVAQASADAGLVYASDAAREAEQVHVLCAVPAQEEILYPAALLHENEAARLFYNFLQEEETLTLFENAGFTPV